VVAYRCLTALGTATGAITENGLPASLPTTVWQARTSADTTRTAMALRPTAHRGSKTALFVNAQGSDAAVE
jgi:hypothetical protein